MDTRTQEYKADFLDDYSIEQAANQFANAKTEDYRRLWWKVLQERIREVKQDNSANGELHK